MCCVCKKSGWTNIDVCVKENCFLLSYVYVSLVYCVVILYAVERPISMLFTNNKHSVVCSTKFVLRRLVPLTVRQD